MRLDTITRDLDPTLFSQGRFVFLRKLVYLFSLRFPQQNPSGSKRSWLETDNGKESIKIPFDSCPLQLFRIVSLCVNFLTYLPIPSRVHQSSFPNLTQIYR